MPAANITGYSDSYCYKMTYKYRGDFIIINNKTFNQNTGMGTRTGTDVDAGNLHKLFSDLGFRVVLKQNQTRDQMHSLMIEGMKDYIFCMHSQCVFVIIIIVNVFH